MTPTGKLYSYIFLFIGNYCRFVMYFVDNEKSGTSNIEQKLLAEEPLLPHES